jgi:UDP-2,3-diacylglucosamine hydrolase
VILFVSDMHFGRGAEDEERAKEAALIDCLEAHADAVEHLYLVGDVFDAYIEYRHLMPKGVVRFQALLARWTDRDVPVTYLVGNHDPWHRDYFSTELGVRVCPGALTTTHHGVRLRLAHGDAAAAHGLSGWLRAWLRHPVPVSLYRRLLPADTGMDLAKWAKDRFGQHGPDPATADVLKARARSLLRTTAAAGVVFAHSHQPALHTWPEGVYLNTGCWHEARTLGRLDAHGIHLLRWNGTQTLSIEARQL